MESENCEIGQIGDEYDDYAELSSIQADTRNPAPDDCLTCQYQSESGVNGDCLLWAGCRSQTDEEAALKKAPKNCPYVPILIEEIEAADSWRGY